MNSAQLFAGVMTGNSLDAIDIAVLQIGESSTHGTRQERLALVCFHSQPLDSGMREALQSLLLSGHDELHRASLIGNGFADQISRATLEALTLHGLKPSQIRALGVHGQTLRHRPDLGYSLQLNAPARIAEVTGITVVSDFRSRDIAAGGQGAPLVPGFHRAVFGDMARGPADPGGVTAVVNIGGIANISWLAQPLTGYDTGPGNLLMDAWAQQHLGQPLDRDGQWAQRGTVNEALLSRLLADPFFKRAAPRSTGRELFCKPWLEAFLSEGEFSSLPAEDVQATLLALTARSIAHEIKTLESQGSRCARLIVCGGGAHNHALLSCLRRECEHQLGRSLCVETSQAHGWNPQVIEASAFAWLAWRTLEGLAGNSPDVTGALGPRVLGSITPGAHQSTRPSA
jgi:anhydro-N-acetylmuramic acid kinase